MTKGGDVTHAADVRADSVRMRAMTLASFVGLLMSSLFPSWTGLLPQTPSSSGTTGLVFRVIFTFGSGQPFERLTYTKCIMRTHGPKISTFEDVRAA
jgi:hypothetical protein